MAVRFLNYKKDHKILFYSLYLTISLQGWRGLLFVTELLALFFSCSHSLAGYGAISTDSDQIQPVRSLAQAGWCGVTAGPILGESQALRAMLTGSALLSKVSELQDTNASRTDIVLACGYVKEDGKASYVAFYEALLAAKYPNGLPSANITETELEFDDEAHEEKFEELCENYPQKAVEIYYENMGNFDDFEEAYQGEFESEAHFTEEWIANMGDNIPSYIVIDYQQTWDSALRYDYWEEGNYFFLNI